jgi:hypothetical protein
MTEFNLVQYNIFCRPSPPFFDSQEYRASIIPSSILDNIHDIDVFTFCEAFDDHARNILLNEFDNLGYKYI